MRISLGYKPGKTFSFQQITQKLYKNSSIAKRYEDGTVTFKNDNEVYNNVNVSNNRKNS